VPWHFCISAGTEGAGGAGGTTSTSAPPFFCNLQLKVTLQTFNTKILENSPAPRRHCTLRIAFSKLYFEFDCIDCFFAPPNRKIVPARLCIFIKKLIILTRAGHLV